MELIPRYKDQGYSDTDISRRRRWLEKKTSSKMDHVGAYSINGNDCRGNVENLIGCAQVPIGVAGPLLVRGSHADGQYFIPLATTEGALVRSFERGMRAITQAGGADVAIARDGNRASPIFAFQDLAGADHFQKTIPGHFTTLKEVGESTTSHGKLQAMKCRPAGRNVIVDLDYHTGDAHGMNMIARATQAVCEWIEDRYEVECFYPLTGGSLEKRGAAAAFHGGKGKGVTAAVLLTRRILRTHFHSTADRMQSLWHRTLVSQLQAGSPGYNGHYANGLTAIFIACGQDVANVSNASVGVTDFELQGDELYVSVTLPSLTLATIGGGTGLGTAAECLQMLGCFGTGKACAFAEIVAATLLAGELSFAAALSSGEFVNAHQQYGRNPPKTVPQGGRTTSTQA